jgi:predicted MPP superfamily phosphohydrolase
MHPTETKTVIYLAISLLVPLLACRSRPRFAFAILPVVCMVVPIIVTIVYPTSGFFKLRLLAWGVFAAFPLGALLCALIARKRARVLSRTAVAASVMVLGIYGFAFHVEPYRLEVNRHEVFSARITEPLRIVLLADIQTDSIGEYESRVFEAVRAAQPDLILLAGDYLQSSDRVERKLAPLFQRLFNDPPLRPRYGIHAVEGDCEAQEDWEYQFHGTSVITHDVTEVVEIGPLTVTCLTLHDSHSRQVIERPADRFHIALGHHPNFALQTVDADLLLAGHCHGGQVRIPFLGPPIKLAAIPRAWTQGMTDLGNGRKLVVSRGIGMERGGAPRLRFLCRPEVIVIDLLPLQQARDASN